MYRPIFGLMAMFAVGIAVGSMGTGLLKSAQVEDLVAMSYLGSASDARSFAQAAEDIRSHQDTQAIRRLDGYLSAALVSLADYETAFPADKREPRIYEALAIVRKYIATRPELTLPPEATRALVMEGKD